MKNYTKKYLTCYGIYAFDKRYGTCKFVWFSVVHTPVIDYGYVTGNRALPFNIFSSPLPKNMEFLIILQRYGDF
jgi:hypothetical protein